MFEKLNEKYFGKTVKSVMNSFCLLFNDIDDNSAKEVIGWILEANFTPPEERPDILNLLICSPGGELAAAFAVIDVIRSSQVPIRTVGLGQIASAGLMIFMAGQQGERILTPNTSIMSHQWAGGSLGKAHELFAAGKEFVLTRDRMLHHYINMTGLSEKQVNKYLLPESDIYLSAEEAKKLNLCDKIALF